jgi:predicted HicB family RNase H-like nuclease
MKEPIKITQRKRVQIKVKPEVHLRFKTAAKQNGLAVEYFIGDLLELGFEAWLAKTNP